MKMMETFKKEVKNSIKEMEGKTIKKLEEINKSLQEKQEKAIKQVKETVLDLMIEIELIKKTHKLRELWKLKIRVTKQELQRQV